MLQALAVSERACRIVSQQKKASSVYRNRFTKGGCSVHCTCKCIASGDHRTFSVIFKIGTVWNPNCLSSNPVSITRSGYSPGVSPLFLGSSPSVSWTFMKIAVFLLMELEELDLLFSSPKALLTVRYPLSGGFRLTFVLREYCKLRMPNSFA